MTLALWIDPVDDAVVTGGDSPTTRITSIADKSPAGNDVSVLGASVLCNFDGADEATSYTSEDSGARTATFVGNAKLDNAQVKFGTTSLRTDGANDRLTFPDSTDFEFGAADFTIECWVRFNGDPGAGSEAIMGQYLDTGDQRGWVFYLDVNTLKFGWSTDGTSGSFASQSYAWNPLGNTWYHVAASRTNGNLYLFVDGALLGSAANTATIFAPATTLGIGGISASFWDLDGWIDDVRIIKGVGMYSAAFQVPLHPHSDGPLLSTQVLPPQAALLCDFDGADAATSFTSGDAAARTATFNGNAQLDTAQKKFGASSLLLDGTGDYVTFPDSDDWHLAAEDFTIEFWVRHNTAAASSIHTYMSHYDSSDANASWIIRWQQSTPALAFVYSAAGTGDITTVTSSSWTPTVGQWYHIAATRVGGTLRMFADGVKIYDAPLSVTFFDAAKPLDIGVVRGGGGLANYFDGWIDDVRVIKGTGIYTADFKPRLRPHVNGPDPFNDRRAMVFQPGSPLTRGGSPSLTNMDGPDFTVLAAFSDDGTLGLDDGLVSMSDGVWAADASGWRIKKTAPVSPESAALQGSVGDASTHLIDVSNGDTIGAMTIGALSYDATNKALIGYANGVYGGRDLVTQSPEISLGFGNDLNIGWVPGGTTWNSGVIGDIIYFDGLLPSDERQRAEGYLAWKWGITLPAGHPFKYRPPDIVIDSEVLMLFNGADGATSYTTDDSVGRTVSFFGTAQLVGDTRISGPTSLYLDGNSDYVTIPDHVDLELDSTTDMTAEAWVYVASTPVSSATIFNKGGVSGSVWPNWTMSVNGSDFYTFGIYANGSLLGQAISITTAPLGEWVHVAGVWDAANDLATIYINGVAEHSATCTGTPYSTNTNPLNIGHQPSSASDYLPGYIDQVRITQGKQLYTNDFEPPPRGFRLPLAAQLIANFNGLDGEAGGSPEYLVDSGQVATFLGGAAIDTAQNKFGTSSLELVASPVSYVTIPDSTDWEFGAGDFTVEFWVRFNTDPATNPQAFIGQYTTAGDQRGWLVDLSSNNLRLAWTTDGAAGTFASITNAWNPAANVWYHVAVQRRGNVLFSYVDGVLIGVDAITATIFAPASTLSIGANGGGAGGPLDGWMDGIRIVKGRALYGFPDLPDAPFDNTVDDSELLINFEGANGATSYTTDDTVARTLTFVSTAQLDNTEKRVGTTSLRTGLTSTAAVTIPSAADLALGTGDFTIEYYQRAGDYTGTQLVYDQRTGASSVHPVIYMNAAVLTYYTGGTARITGASLTPGIWYHIAVVRSNGVTRMYLDGVQTGSSYTDGNNYGQNAIGFGDATYVTGNSFNGWLDMLRVNVGKALYGGDFDPPIAEPAEPII